MIVFLGLLYSPEDEKRILKSAKNSTQAAANNFQWGILKGLRQSTEDIVIVNSVPMGTYPKHSSILFEKNSKDSAFGIEINNCGYLNIPFIKQLQRTYKAIKQIEHCIKNTDERIAVVVYSLYLPYLKALERLKKHNDFNYIVIVPDLPGEYGIMSGNPIKRIIEKNNGARIYNSANSADAYVLLTEQMKDVLNVGGKPYTIVEGVYNKPVNENDIKNLTFHEKNILYTGTLDVEFGIKTLIEAFEKLPWGSAKLIIAGRGDYESSLKEKCAKNGNIKYLGFISREEVLDLQSKAWILVNPRSAKEEYTKYSFPSKTMEYLASGKPVVMNKLPGIPKEYYEHIYFTDTDDVDGLAAKLSELLQTDSRKLLEKGEKTKKFIAEKKSGATQAEKIVDLIKLL